MNDKKNDNKVILTEMITEKLDGKSEEFLKKVFDFVLLND